MPRVGICLGKGRLKVAWCRGSRAFAAVTVWPEICVNNCMQRLIDPSPVRLHSWTAFLLTLLMASYGRAAKLPISDPYTSADMAFARYVDLQGQRDPFANSEPVVVMIEASLPGLYKSAAVVAIRQQGADELQVLQLAGDGTVLAEVLDRYFTIREQIDGLPADSIAITPANYKFHFGGQVNMGGATAYVYDVVPKKKRPGLLSGQLWMESGTGREVMLAGYLSDMSAARGRVDVVRETRMINGAVAGRVTHVAFTLPRLGRAEVVVTEAPPKFLALPPVE